MTDLIATKPFTNNPFITIVWREDHTCKLLVLYTENKYYYSQFASYKELCNFKQPLLIETHTDKLVLHSKNNKHILKIEI